MCLAHSMAHSMLPDVTRASDSTARHPGHPGHPGHLGHPGHQLGADRDGQRSTTCDGAAWQRSGHIGNSPKHLGWDATNGEEMSYG